MRFHFNELDGKRIAYSDETIFLVQIARGKGSYKTKYSFKGNLGQAVMYFNGLNIRSPFKKRLFCSSMNKSVLARQTGV